MNKEYLTKIWNLKRKNNYTLRQQALRCFVIFLMLMILFTFLSRAADSLTIAQVTVEHPSSRVIEHTVSADGKAMENQEQAIIVDEGIRIKTVYVKEGDSVKKGDLLLTFDLDQLEESIEEVKKEIKTLELTNDSLDETKAIEAQNRQTAKKRAREDYNQAKEENAKAVKQAKENLEEAKKSLKEYRKERKKISNNDNSMDYGNDNPNINNNENIINNVTGDTEQSLSADIKEKQAAYQEALKNQKNALEEAKRALEDADTPVATDNSDKINDLQIDTLQQKLEKLNKLKKKKGKVTSPADGVITSVSAVTGSKSTEEAAFLMADLSSGIRFVAQFSKDQEKYLSKDAAVSLTPSDSNTQNDGYTIESITPDSENPDILNVSLLITDKTLNIGQTATMTVTQESTQYMATIPLDAVHENNQEQYVLVMQQKDTVLGEEWFAQKISVTVLDKNDKYAALEEGVIHEDQSIILSSNKSIDNGDRVRLAEGSETE